MPLSKTERALHRKTMARCFNEAWTYLEKRGRTPHESRLMLNLAHTARHHAALAGTARNQAIGDWQISRVYATLGEPRLAVAFARSALDLCERNELTDLTCTAYEAMARSHAVGHHPSSARSWLTKAREQLDTSVTDAEDRTTYLGQIRDTERLLRRRSSGRARRSGVKGTKSASSSGAQRGSL